MIHVALDMDGVLADLAGALNTWTGHPDIDSDKAAFWKALPPFAMQGGFQHLPKMSNADRLVDFVTGIPSRQVSLSILTSAGDFYSPTSEVVIQKKRWIDKNFPKLTKVPFTATSSGGDKAFFAHPKFVLVDDHIKNIEKFNKAGGVGFLWSNTDKDLTELKHMLFNMYKD